MKREAKTTATAESHALPHEAPITVRGHLPTLDALRGLAVLMVTLYHVGGAYPGPAASGTTLLPALDVGARGVDLFFVLSGFLITGILYDTKGQSGYLVNFFARRSLRIFPLYYGVLIVALLIWPWIAGGPTWQREAAENSGWLWLYGTNLLIAARGDWCFGAFDHFWSLAVEEQFYLVWPFVVLWLPRKRAMLFCALLIAAAMLSRLAWILANGSEESRYALAPFRMDTLAAGAWIALYIRDGGSLQSLVRTARIALLAAVLLLIPISLLELRLASLTDVLWTVAFASLLVATLAAQQGSVLGVAGRSRVLQWPGKYCYGIYIFGNLVIAVLAPYVTATGLGKSLGNAYAGQLAYAALIVMVTILLAVGSWHLYEKHFLALKRFFTTSQPGKTDSSIAAPSDPADWNRQSAPASGCRFGEETLPVGLTLENAPALSGR